MIKHLKGLEINSIYDFDNAFSINELLCKFWEKIEETINISNESIDILNWVKEQGLSAEVQALINQLVADGTIERMINVDKIEELRNLINSHYSELLAKQTEITEARKDNITGIIYNTIGERIDNINSQLEDIVFYNKKENDIQNLLNNASNLNKKVILKNGEYNIHTLTFKKNVYYLKNVVFVINENNGNDFNITINEGCRIDELNIKYNGNVDIKRLLKIKSNVEIETINIYSQEQKGAIENIINAAIILEGNNININYLKTTNFDYPLNIYNCTNVNINNIEINSFVRGVYVRKSKDVYIDYLETRTFSPNATFNAGHNGLLIEECEDLTFNIININDCGEHGIRIGGIREGDYKQKNFYFNKVNIKRCMRNGFKMLTSTDDIIKNVVINELTVTDANYNGSSGDNKDGLRLEGTENITVGSLIVKNEFNSRSCSNALFVTNSKNVLIDNLVGNNIGEEGILVSDTSGVVNDIYIKNINLRNTDLELIKVDHKTETLRDIVFTNIYGRGFKSEYGVNLLVNIVSQPIILEGYINKGSQTGIYNTNAGTTSLEKITNKLIEV